MSAVFFKVPENFIITCLDDVGILLELTDSSLLQCF